MADPGSPVERWFVRLQPDPGATLRLFCFPYAGGGAPVFHPWRHILPDSVEVCAAQYPGEISWSVR